MADYAKDWYERTQRPKVSARQQVVQQERERIRRRTTKKCSWCAEILPRSAFGQHKGTLDGLQAYCRECMTEYQLRHYESNPDKHEQRKRRQSEWQRNLSPEKKKAARLRALLGRYGLSEEKHAALYKACDHRCPVCTLHAWENKWKGLSGQLCVDHMLVHGKVLVRGLLCNRCNSLLGRMGDDLAGVMRYVRYLERYQASKEGTQDAS